jgi:hypothetical protein
MFLELSNYLNEVSFVDINDQYGCTGSQGS